MITNFQLFQLISALNNKTNEFIISFLNKKITFPNKEWKIWDFKSGIPNQELPGCYAFISKTKIHYIGVGAGLNSGIYNDAGLGQRLHNYWRLSKDSESNKYEISPKWLKKHKLSSQNIHLTTFGFKPEYRCIAYALEVYLIDQLKPEINVSGKNEFDREK